MSLIDKTILTCITITSHTSSHLFPSHIKIETFTRQKHMTQERPPSGYRLTRSNKYYIVTFHFSASKVHQCVERLCLTPLTRTYSDIYKSLSFEVNFKNSFILVLPYEGSYKCIINSKIIVIFNVRNLFSEYNNKT